MDQNNWHQLHHPEEIISPSLLVYPERVLHNITTMIQMAGGTALLRPHIKTHKCAEIIALQMKHGINKFKCATIAEAELLGNCKVPDVLLAMQPVGFDIQRLVMLMKMFPGTQFSALVDNQHIAKQIGSIAGDHQVTIPLYIDLNVGMNRTGIAPREEALELYRFVDEHPSLQIEGLHAYDGHLRNPDPKLREKECDLTFETVQNLKQKIIQAQLPEPIIIAGGSPTFPFHGKRKNVVASPGTTLLWDAGYGNLFPEMGFIPAAVLFTRIISKPLPGKICMDLGHKAIASEMNFPRVEFLSLDNEHQASQSEEHFIIDVTNEKSFHVGDVHYAIPKHICPTVAKYDYLQVVEDGKISTQWKVAARNYKLTL